MHLSNRSRADQCSSAISIHLYVELTVQQVAVKSLQVYASDEGSEGMAKKTGVGTLMKVCVGWAYHYHLQRIRRELKICAKLKHPNILHVHGYTSGFGPFMAIVSLWAEKGNLTTYLEDEKEKNLSLIRRFLLVSFFSIICR
jgi:hypothetical protein